MKSFNNWLANRLGNTLSSMSFFYICVILDLVELPPVIRAHDVITWCTYLAQTVVQLIALPILAYQNRVQQGNHEEHMSYMKALHKHLGIKHTYRNK